MPRKCRRCGAEHPLTELHEISLLWSKGLMSADFLDLDLCHQCCAGFSKEISRIFTQIREGLSTDE